MKRETIRMLNAGAEDATNGITAKIAAVSLDAGDTRPAAVTVYNDVEHAWVARRKLNAEDTSVTLPALAIFQFAPLEVIDVELETIVRDANLKIAFAYLTKKSDPLEATSDGQYVNRALLQFLHWFMRNAQSSAFRTRNGIIIRAIEEGGLTQDDIHEDWNGAVMVASTIATFRVRETEP